MLGELLIERNLTLHQYRQSHYREGDSYGTGIEIGAGFGPVRQLLRPVFSCFHEQKKIFKNILDGENIFGIE